MLRRCTAEGPAAVGQAKPQRASWIIDSTNRAAHSSSFLVLFLRTRAEPPRLTTLAASLAALLAAPAWAQTTLPDEPIELRPSPALQPLVRGDAARKLPAILRAQTLSGRPDLETVAEG